jgi:hypothetical protein
MSKKILYKGKFPTTPEIILRELHDYWIQKVSLEQPTEINELQFDYEKIDEHYSLIYIKQGSLRSGIITHIDVRRLNDQVVQITIIANEEKNRFYADELWRGISSQIDLFLFTFASYLEELYSGSEENDNSPQAKAKLSTGDLAPTHSKKVDALNRLAVLWVEHNQGRISNSEGMSWFLEERAADVGLPFVAINEFKKHLPKAYKAGIIAKDNKTGHYIPKLAT